MTTSLITGATAGIGLEFARQYLAEGWRVFGTFRTESDRVKLRDLGVQTLKLDVQDVNDLASFSWGPDIQFGILFPVHYQEDQPFDITYEDIDVIYPDLDVVDLAIDLARDIKDDIFD